MLSPLALVGMTKAEIRALSRRRAIPTWAQPSSPCLSSRLPYGTAVTPARLAQVERAEAALRALGVEGDLRVRHHGDLARVELGGTELDRWLDADCSALVSAVRTAKQFLTYVSAGPLQPAVAAGLRLPDEHFSAIARDLEYRRDVLVQGLTEAGLPVISPEGTYFATVDVRSLQPDGDGMAFCRSLPDRAGVVAVPTVVFYDPAHAHLGRHLVRFAFCKGDDVLTEAVKRLRESS